MASSGQTEGYWRDAHDSCRAAWELAIKRHKGHRRRFGLSVVEGLKESGADAAHHEERNNPARDAYNRQLRLDDRHEKSSRVVYLISEYKGYRWYLLVTGIHSELRVLEYSLARVYRNRGKRHWA